MNALIDTHTHLYTEEFDADRELAVIRAVEAGVTRLLCLTLMIRRSRLCSNCVRRTIAATR